MELSKKNYDKQFTTVTTHKNIQNYYNEKCTKYLMFEEKLICGLENDMRNMANFHQSNSKSQNWDNDEIL